MAFDTENNYFIARIDLCAKHLTQEELDQLQGLIKKVDIISKQEDEFIIVSQKERPKMFSAVKKMIDQFYQQKQTITAKKDLKPFTGDIS